MNRLATISHLSAAIQALSDDGASDDLAHQHAVAELQGALISLGLETLAWDEHTVAASKRGRKS